ncbi:MAG: hypothetical protein JWO86_2629 [Myxococcaceae bacterium]|nr:hypothetical protein [Myxococcaceae bacterium]
MSDLPETKRPRWVNVLALLAIAFVVLFAILHLAGGGMGGHGP